MTRCAIFKKSRSSKRPRSPGGSCSSNPSGPPLDPPSSNEHDMTRRQKMFASAMIANLALIGCEPSTSAAPDNTTPETSAHVATATTVSDAGAMDTSAEDDTKSRRDEAVRQKDEKARARAKTIAFQETLFKKTDEDDIRTFLTAHQDIARFTIEHDSISVWWEGRERPTIYHHPTLGKAH